MKRSRSTSVSTAPAANAPRMISRPSFSASAANAMRTTTAPRTRIWAVVSCRRARSSITWRERSAPVTTRYSAKPIASSAPISSSVVVVPPPSPVNRTDSRMIAPKSAIVPAATTSWPNGVAISPASLSTGMITPSDVAERITATSSGVCTRPPASSA